MSITTINQPWRSKPGERSWNLQLIVSAADLTPDEFAAIEPLVAAAETYAALLARQQEGDDNPATDVPWVGIPVTEVGP